MPLSAPSFRTLFLVVILVLSTSRMVMAQQSSDDSGNSDGGTSSGSTGSPQNSGSQGQSPAPIPLPANSSLGTPSDSSLQVTPPSVTLPTPDLPPPTPLPDASASPTPAPTPDQSAIPSPTPQPQFNPPSAQRLNLPSAQPAGNPTFAPASVGMANMTLDDSAGPGAMASLFDWAKKLRFQAALRGGFDDNVNSGNGTNKIASTFANLNGGVNYRFGSPRLNINVDLTGGVTRYFNSNISKPTQETVGLGLSVDYRFNPRMVFTFNSSSSYQEQPNITLAGTPNNSTAPYYYTANSLAAAYQWSDLFTTVTRFDGTANYYPNQSKSTNGTNNQGFIQPGFDQSFRYLIRPTTTAVLDYNTDLYGYGSGNSGNSNSSSSWGQTVTVGFDHTFNPKWYWNFRAGGEYRTSQNAAPYFGPYFDSNFSWVFSRASSVSWVLHYGTQPSGQNNTSYNVALRTGATYTQGIFTRLSFDAGLYYLLSSYSDAIVGVSTNSMGTLETQSVSYNQANIQGNVDLTYKLNRIIDLAIGYQYIKQTTPSSYSSISSQDYTRGITYLQIRGGF